MKHLFIINPAAGSRNPTESYRKQIAEVCGEMGVEYSIEISGAPVSVGRLPVERQKRGSSTAFIPAAVMAQ